LCFPLAHWLFTGWFALTAVQLDVSLSSITVDATELTASELFGNWVGADEDAWLLDQGVYDSSDDVDSIGDLL